METNDGRCSLGSQYDMAIDIVEIYNQRARPASVYRRTMAAEQRSWTLKNRKRQWNGNLFLFDFKIYHNSFTCAHVPFNNFIITLNSF